MEFKSGKIYYGNTNSGATLSDPLDLKITIIKLEINIIKRTKKYITYQYNGNTDRRYIYKDDDDIEYIELFYNCFVSAKP
tara:strand:+ start:152 stop:391 length:240 start_codon:yes stop_codon:yes gene_type:complete